MCVLHLKTVAPAPTTDWQQSNHVPITAKPLDTNTIFFQEVGQTIDTIGTLHAHITVDLQRPLLQLQRINITVNNGITAVHNQLVTFVHIIRNYPKYDATKDHLLSNRITDQNRLLDYLIARNYEGLLKDVQLINRFSTTTYLYALSVPHEPIELDGDLIQEYITPNQDPLQHTRARLTRTFPTLIQELQQWLDLQNDILKQQQQITPFISSTPRQKRFLPLLIAGATILASTFLGTWNTVEIQHLKTANHELIVRVDQIVQHQLADDEHLNLIDGVINIIHQDLQQIQLDRTHQQFIGQAIKQFNAVQLEIGQINQIVDGLMNHKLASSVIDHEIIYKMYTNLSRTATNLDYQLLPTDTFQLLQCPTSFIAQNHDLTIFLHIPITRSDANKLTIYKHIPLPFHIHQQPAIITRPNKPYIAINSRQQTFFTMSTNEFQACNPVGKLFVCYNQIMHNHPNSQTIRNATIPRDDACLYALFLQQAETATQICDVFPTKQDPPQLHQVHADQVLVHTFQPTVVLTTCPNHAHSDLHIQQPTLVTIPPSCTLSTSHSSFTATINLDRSFQHKIYTWPHDPIQFLLPLQSSIALQSLYNRLPSLHPATNLKLWAQHSQHDDYLYLWNLCNSILIISVTIFSCVYFMRLPVLIARNFPVIPSAPPPSPGFIPFRQDGRHGLMTVKP